MPLPTIDEFCTAHRLTKTETRAVRMLVRGLSNREIAARMGTTEQVIKNHLHAAFRAVGMGGPTIGRRKSVLLLVNIQTWARQEALRRKSALAKKTMGVS